MSDETLNTPPEAPRDAGADAEAPSSIPDDVRARWADTWLRGTDYVLVDADKKELARVPFSEANTRYYMGGPEQNAAIRETWDLETLNEGRVATGQIPLVSLAQIQDEELRARRGQQGRGGVIRDTDNLPKEMLEARHAALKERLFERVVPESDRAQLTADIEAAKTAQQMGEVVQRLRAFPLLRPRPVAQEAEEEEVPPPPPPGLPPQAIAVGMSPRPAAPAAAQQPQQPGAQQQRQRQGPQQQRQGQQQAPQQPQAPRAPEFTSVFDNADELARIRDENAAAEAEPAAAAPEIPPMQLGEETEILVVHHDAPYSDLMPVLFQKQGPTAPSLDGIFRDKPMREMFGNFLGNVEGGTVILNKYTEDPASLSRDEIRMLGLLRGKFAERLTMRNELRDSMAPEDIQYLLKNNPAFGILRESFENSPERAAEIIKDYLSKTFMEVSDTEMAKMVLAHRAVRKIRTEPKYDDLKKRSELYCMRRGIDPGRTDFTKDPALTAAILRPGWFDGIFLGGRRAANRANTLVAVGNALEDIGDVIGGSLSRHNDELAAAVRDEVVKGIRVPATGASEPENFAAAVEGGKRVERDLRNIESLRARIRDPRYRERFRTADGRGWDEASPGERRDTFFDGLKDEHGWEKRRGWLGRWLSAIFESLLAHSKRQLPESEFE